jgi:hypothetical protein
LILLHLSTAHSEILPESLDFRLIKGSDELSRRQRMFLLEELVGLNDKNAALAAGLFAEVP